MQLSAAEVPSFASRLAASVAVWRGDGLNSAMLRIPIEHAALAGVAAQHGFVYHHAEGGHAVLKVWLKPERPDKMPPFASHQVGVAGFVLNERRELLVVKEWRDLGGGTLEKGTQWKLPGGLLDRGESFSEGVTREVLEETGVRTAFHSILSFWHRHGLTWSQSDLYFVARLKPLSHEIRLQPCEISEARWMPLVEFVRSSDHPLILAILDKMYGLRKHREAAAEARTDELPFAELVEAPVQFPGRAPFPTFFPIVRSGTR